MILFMIHRLADILKERGAKTRLAKKLGKPDSVISDLCAGNDRLNDDLIRDISKALGIPAWQLFVDPKDVIPREYIELMEAYKCLDKDRKILVDDMFIAAKHRAHDTGSPKKTSRS